MKVSTRATSVVCTASYPEQIFVAKKYKEKSDPKYQITMIFDTNETGFEDAIKAAIAKKFPDGAPKGIKLPIKDGNQKKDKEGKPRKEYAGKLYAVAWSNEEDKPGVYDTEVVNGKLRPITNKKEVYGGCKVRVDASAFVYESGSDVGVSLYLKNVQKVGEGEPFGLDVSPEDAFSSEPSF